MRYLPTVRRFTVVALMATASIAVVTASGPAGATGGTVTCTDVTGSQKSSAEFYNCDPADTTGGGGSIAPHPVFMGTHTATIDWDLLSTSDHATTVIHVTTHAVRGKKNRNALCTSGVKELRVSGTVRSDTSGSVTVGGAVSATLCQEPNGGYALAENSSFIIGE
jgi:hypothetical protein